MDRNLSQVKLALPILYFFVLSVGVVFSSGYLILNSQGRNFTFAKESEDVQIEISKQMNFQLEIKDHEVNDIRIKKINAFFHKKFPKSPVKAYGEVFVKEADKNQIDWKLLPAIAVIESGAGTSLTAGSTNNLFGWGFNDDKSKNNDKVTNHDSFEHSIALVSQKIRQSYYDKGLLSVEQIVKKYNPGSVVRAGGNPELATWTQNIRKTMEQINDQTVE